MSLAYWQHACWYGNHAGIRLYVSCFCRRSTRQFNARPLARVRTKVDMHPRFEAAQQMSIVKLHNVLPTAVCLLYILNNA